MQKPKLTLDLEQLEQPFVPKRLTTGKLSYETQSPRFTDLPKLSSTPTYKPGTLQNASFCEQALINMSNELISNPTRLISLNKSNNNIGNLSVHKYKVQEKVVFNITDGYFKAFSSQKPRSQSIIEQIKPIKPETYKQNQITNKNKEKEEKGYVEPEQKKWLTHSQEEYFKQMNNKIDTALNNIQKMRNIKDQVSVVNLCDRDKQLFVLK
ncbi:Hypothetical_protein [Hexamita inflata]|uniref:Hypothetical_protein n=1 Tax=Hexamita inflata TaxID=28002 RepID=A0AA86UD00_9EUKA|nr:Hypothetical protein HINF_LOCUS34846 [Hexamita inflata]